MTQPRPDFYYLVPIGGIAYQLRLKWNTRFSFWTLDVSAQDGTPLVHGRKLLPSAPPLLGLAIEALQGLNLVALRADGSGARIERTELGNEVRLYAIGPEVLGAAI